MEISDASLFILEQLIQFLAVLVIFFQPYFLALP
jgi:hypothetical protein